MRDGIANPERRAPIELRKGAKNHQSAPRSRISRQTGVKSIIDKRLVEKQRRATGVRSFADAPDFLRFKNAPVRVVWIIQKNHVTPLCLDALTETLHRRSKQIGAV